MEYIRKIPVAFLFIRIIIYFMIQKIMSQFNNIVKSFKFNYLQSQFLFKKKKKFLSFQ
jgi:hypothetical protein